MMANIEEKLIEKAKKEIIKYLKKVHFFNSNNIIIKTEPKISEKITPDFVVLYGINEESSEVIAIVEIKGVSKEPNINNLIRYSNLKFDLMNKSNHGCLYILILKAGALNKLEQKYKKNIKDFIQADLIYEYQIIKEEIVFKEKKSSVFQIFYE